MTKETPGRGIPLLQTDATYLYCIVKEEKRMKITNSSKTATKGMVL